jgi:hypothetical protein
MRWVSRKRRNSRRASLTANTRRATWRRSWSPCWPNTAPKGLDEYRPGGLTQRLGIHRDTVRRWVRVGWVTVRQYDDGQHVIWIDADEFRRLRELHQLRRTRANKARAAKLTTPKPQPPR